MYIFVCVCVCVFDIRKLKDNGQFQKCIKHNYMSSNRKKTQEETFPALKPLHT